MNESVSKPETQANKKNNRTLTIMLAVSVLPILAAYTAFFTGMGVPDNTVNSGELISPALPVKALFSEAQEEEALAFAEEKKWRILLPYSASCSQECEQNFYTTRQVHIRLGEKGFRVQRYAINLSNNDNLKAKFEDHPKLKFINIAEDTWKNWTQSLDHSRHFYLLVDQEGFAMMRYTSDQHGNELLKDIKRALKYSIDYQ